MVPRPGSTPGTGRRDTTKNADWLAAVGSLKFCVLCGAYGIQVAHRDEGKGMGMKSADALTAALCPGCHHELGNGNKLSRDERRAEMNRAIVLTLEKLAAGGLVIVNKEALRREAA
ncbi:hypothetical protein BKX93_01640 [Chromobacterium vaccinii]|uniref:DUF1364 domain-containing protein n=1 Tax=Chromobacterium vaccinii TaxID=1108595 RepID=A0A1D9LN13_9NEIS|nr:hypothetical protein BKX93_01640 [Chromobacterium vaccinii]